MKYFLKHLTKSLFSRRLPAIYCKRFFDSMVEKNYIEPSASYEDIPHHIPVMPEEIIKALCPLDNQVLMDMTFGGGGHSRHILSVASVKLYCLDRDPCAYQKAVELSKEFGNQVVPMLGKFSEMKSVLSDHGVKPNSLDGIVIDAGCSSMQMDSAERGFSISRNGILDMRMDGNRYPDQPTAADVLNSLDMPTLAKIFKTYGEEKHSKKIAQALIDARYMLKTINTTHELADLIHSIMEGAQRYDKLNRAAHAATKVFQALRIFVNNELNELNYGLEMAHQYLKPGGRIAVVSFHSLEDRIAKRHFLGIDLDETVCQAISQKYKNRTLCHTTDDVEKLLLRKWNQLHKHVITPSEEEVLSNPRSRSAKLRVAEKQSVVS